MVQVSKNMNTYLDTHAPKGPLNCKDMVGSFALDIVACCAYGLDGTALVNPHSEFAEIGRVFLAPSIRQGIEQMIIMLFPRLAGFLNIGITKKEVTKFFQRVMKEAVVFRQKNNVRKNDFLQLLISLKEKSQGKKVVNWYDEFTDDDVAAHCMTFFFDGYETSSNSLMYTLYELAVNPDVQGKLTDEIVASLETTNGEITYEGILEMKYLDMSVRKYPSVPFIGRLCTKPFELEASNGLRCRVEPGTPVMTPTLGIHHDAKYYPDPLRFDPDRFTEENIQRRHRYAFLPFGEGPRQCLGARFGEALVKCGIVSILAHYEILPTEKTPKELSHSPQAFIFVTDDEVWLQFRKRS
ncbi:hypothetical protein PR048_018325 [Dryococelus australis]|uniref:Cytochrome P450 n=1 Tax=Dryococelus australis TaxID=614101 RepID=A0ABQ9HC47_9NEOP|nr:hypothetical protein PR048_018325 [Dryococelus australis]